MIFYELSRRNWQAAGASPTNHPLFTLHAIERRSGTIAESVNVAIHGESDGRHSPFLPKQDFRES